MSDKSATHSNISAAIYLVTSFFVDQEPLKWRLRGLAGDLVSSHNPDKARVSRELSTLFSLARGAGLVSDTNYEILARELNRIGEEAGNPLAFIAERASPVTSSPQTHQEYLEAPLSQSSTRTEPSPVIKDKTQHQPSEEKAPLREFGAVSVKKNGRQSTIIALLKRKKEIMIKDVSPLIPGCSEKTIQRELAEMVEEGILKKIGAKRWTRYTLA
jgi:hypothetical protein